MTWLWIIVDKILRRIYKIKPVVPGADGIIGLEVRVYRGTPIVFSDGMRLEQGECILDIHLNSAWFVINKKMNRERRWEWEVLSVMSRELALLASQVRTGRYGDIRALHTMTVLDAGARRLGFETQVKPPSPGRFWQEFYLARLMSAYYLNTTARVKTPGHRQDLYEGWLSVAQLLKKYPAVAESPVSSRTGTLPP